MDHLSALFKQFTPSARFFYSGNLCETSNFDVTEGIGHLHVLRAGQLTLTRADGESMSLDKPCALLFPRPSQHRLLPVGAQGVDLVCATLELGSGFNNPMLSALPDVLHVPFESAPTLHGTLNLLFLESDSGGGGKQVALDCLTEYLLIQLLRHVIDDGLCKVGILAALGDVRLQPAISAMHEKPEYPWALEELAALANLSRTGFAKRFRGTVGATPIDYLTDWRLSIARSLLREGLRISLVAEKVGYSDQSAFARVFTRRVGVSPRQWLTQNNANQRV